jgi:hypothetical protein
MPSSPRGRWGYTPNKVNHLTKGFTSKVIYNYHYKDGVTVANSSDVFDALVTFNENQKGSCILPANYFAGDDGQGLRITMYFEKALDGADIDIQQGIYDKTNSVLYTIAAPTFTTPVDSGGGTTLAKYECNITKLYVSTIYYLQAVGSILYASKAGGVGVNMTPFNNYVAFAEAGASVIYQFYILNKCSANINIISLMIEELS